MKVHREWAAHSVRETDRCFIAEGRNDGGIEMPYFSTCTQKESSVGKKGKSKGLVGYAFWLCPRRREHGDAIVCRFNDQVTERRNYN